MSYSITQNGKVLDEDLYRLDLNAKVFSSKEDDLVLDFNCLDGMNWAFTTGQDCTFKTIDRCVFTTGGGCTFKTGWGCTFNTGNRCTFNTGNCCTFLTSGRCTFSIYGISSHKFKRGSGIIMDSISNKHYLLNAEFIRMQKIIKG